MKTLWTKFAITLLLFTALGNAATQPVMKMTDISDKTYTIRGTDQGLDIEGMEGKVVFMEFFGHRCPPCLASIPHLINLKKKFKEKLAIVAIEVQGYDHEEVKAFAKKQGMNYTVVSEEKARALVNYVQQRAQWRGSIPFLIALDPNGAVQFVQAGMLPEDALEELYTKLLAMKKSSTKTKK